jgi:hypothetical protein
MTPRDLAIINDLKRFRCMTREDITEIHFSNVSNPVKKTNQVLKRLVTQKHVEVDKTRRMYIYFPIPHIKVDSSKLNHFLSIVQFYRLIRQYEEPTFFKVEPHYGSKKDGFHEPDVEMFWKSRPWFVEVQRSYFNRKQLEEKWNRYEKFYISDKWHDLSWQGEKKVFPYVWVYGVGQYQLDKREGFRIIHSNVEDVVTKIK